MARFLILDIGAGTLDILYYDTLSNLHFKAVARSPVLTIEERAASLPGDLLVLGTEMGGGSLAKILRERAREASVIMSRSASATLNHDPEKVQEYGIKVVDDAAAEDLRNERKLSVLVLADLDLDRLRKIVEGLDVPFSFDGIGICAQDHGVPPSGVSHLDFRHNLFKASLEKDPAPHSLLYKTQEIPAAFNRLRAISQSARQLPAAQVYVMDSGIAAILGASMDPVAEGRERILTLDVATSHTVGAVLEGGEIAGFFEYHTRDITLDKIEILIRQLADGNLEHRRILQEGGPGAYVRRAVGLDRIEIIVATGPKRGMLEGSHLPLLRGSPLGDNMMTGTVGVLEAIRRREGLPPIRYV
jgi:uncharacterized protein (DUF1786 family)